MQCLKIFFHPNKNTVWPLGKPVQITVTAISCRWIVFRFLEKLYAIHAVFPGNGIGSAPYQTVMHQFPSSSTDDECYNWRAACNKLVSDFLGRIFFLVQMSSIFACDLGLNRKTLSRNFFCCFVFRFREIFFNQHWRQMRASLILLFGKTKAFFGKGTARKKTAFLHTLFVENERETSKLKWGAMFFYKVEGHMPKLSSFGRGKKFRPKKSLTSLLHAALQLLL